jgi:hypothetical protein
MRVENERNAPAKRLSGFYEHGILHGVLVRAEPFLVPPRGFGGGEEKVDEV